jgi:hypothetical protein
MPNGMLSPRNVLPSACVPIIGLINAAGSVTGLAVAAA